MKEFKERRVRKEFFNIRKNVEAPVVPAGTVANTWNFLLSIDPDTLETGRPFYLESFTLRTSNAGGIGSSDISRVASAKIKLRVTVENPEGIEEEITNFPGIPEAYIDVVEIYGEDWNMPLTGDNNVVYAKDIYFARPIRFYFTCDSVFGSSHTPMFDYVLRRIAV